MSSTQDVSAGINGELSVGMVGYSFMGAAHSQAWRSAPRFFDLPMRLRMTALAGRDTQRVAQAAGRLGWESTETSWQALVARDDVDLIDVCTPGDTHAEIAIAALEAGKHVLCEKPLANSVEEAEAMTAAAEKAAANGVRSMVGFTYRRVPAIALARQLVAEGRLGTLHHVRAQYLQDWIVDPEAPLSWRLDKTQGGFGRAGRHRRPHRRPHPVHHRRRDRPGLGTPAHLRRRAAAAERARRAERHCRNRPGQGHRGRRRRRSSRSSAGARSASSRPRASPTAARTPSASRSTDPPAAWRSTSRT